MTTIGAAPVGRWLEALASAAPAPGGGAAAALGVATAAGLVEMVCNLTIGKPAYAEHDVTMRAACAEARDARAAALALADEDAAAFTAVVDAYKLPREGDAEAAARRDAIEFALVGAARVPLRTAVVASRVLDLVATALPRANVNVISDLAVAAASAGAALEAAAINVDVNCDGIHDAHERARLADALTRIQIDRRRADELVAAVRKTLAERR
jgi:formiminotetrahydrofolate cyclodeaminase